MSNPFQILGIEPRLVIGREELNQAFRDAGSKVHPDAGGSESAFAALQDAMAALQSPARRLRHWLLLKGIEVESRGSIGPQVMDLFSRVGELTQQVEGLLRRREGAKSALGLAMLEAETHQCREAVEAMIAVMEQAIGGSCESFQAMERGELDANAASELLRDLSFLEKWRASLRGLYGRLL